MVPMLRKVLITLLTASLLFTMTGWLEAISLLPPTIVRAEGKEKLWAKWKVEMDFQHNQVNAVWTVFVGTYDSNGQMTVKLTKSEAVPCKVQGNVIFQNDEAIFDGASHLECLIPSYYGVVMQLVGDQGAAFPDTFKQQCECVNPRPWVAADLTLSTANRVSPLLYQIDNAMQFYTVLDRTGDQLNATSNLLLNQGEALPQVLSWPVNLGQGNQIWSGYDTSSFLLMTDNNWFQFLSADFYQLAKGLTAEKYLHWANPTYQLDFAYSTKFAMTSQPTIFLVGYDTHTHFVGKLRKLAWDPGCGPQDGK